MNYGSLKAALLAMIGRAPADVCYQLVTADINNSLRIREMEATTTLVEAAEITLPADFLAVRAVYRDVDVRTALQPTSLQALNRTHQTSGTPSEYAIVDGKMILNPSPNGTEDIELRYYAKVADFAADSDENDILARFPDIYVFGVLSYHAALVRDVSAAAIWEAKYQAAKRAAKAANNVDIYSGAPLVPSVGYVP